MAWLKCNSSLLFSKNRRQTSCPIITMQYQFLATKKGKKKKKMSYKLTNSNKQHCYNAHTFHFNVFSNMSPPTSITLTLIDRKISWKDKKSLSSQNISFFCLIVTIKNNVVVKECNSSQSNQHRRNIYPHVASHLSISPQAS